MARRVQDDLLDNKVIPFGGRKVLTSENNNDVVTSSGVSTPGTGKVPPITPVQAQAEETPSSYSEVYEMLNKNPTPTDDELEREGRRTRNRQLIAMIGDGLSSIANVVGATKGAQSLNTGSMTKVGSDRHREFLDRRKADQEKYNEGLQRARLIDMNFASQKEAQAQAKELAEKRIKAEGDRAAQAEIARQAEIAYRAERDRVNDARVDRATKDNEEQIKTNNAYRNKALSLQQNSSRGGGEDMSTITYKTYSGEIKTFSYPKSARSGLLAVYPDIWKTDDPKMSEDQMIAHVAANLHKHPALNKKVAAILGIPYEEEEIHSSTPDLLRRPSEKQTNGWGLDIDFRSK